MHHRPPATTNQAKSGHFTSPHNAAVEVRTAQLGVAASAPRLACFDTHHQSRRALRVADVKTLTGDSRSQIYARMNPKCSAHDIAFPRPFYVGKSPRWWEHEVVAWLEAHAALTQR